MTTVNDDILYSPVPGNSGPKDMTRYAQSDAQIPLLKTLSMSETIERLEMALGPRKSAGDIIINIYNAATALPLIYQCVPETVVSAALDAAVLKLSLAKSLGLGCILPFKKNFMVNNVWQSEYRAQFIVMVRGVKELAMRTNRYRRLNDFFIYEGQKGVFNPVTGDFEITGTRTGNKITEYGAYLRLTNGYEHTVCWSAEKVLAHGQAYSPTWDDKKKIFKPGSRWITHFDEQGSKTVMKNLITHHGVISEIDQSNLERIERKSEGAIIDGELSEPEEAPRVEEKPIIINSAANQAPLQEWPHDERILWKNEQLSALVSARYAKNDFNARAMLDMSILTPDATEAEILRWGAIYRQHRDAKTEPGEIRTAQDSAAYANKEFENVPY